MDIGDFLRQIKPSPQAGEWGEVIKPCSAYLILGQRGSGKSGLAYYLLEVFSKEYSLLPAVVGLPPEKRHLIPEAFITPETPLDIPDDSIVLVDEGAMLAPARRSMSAMNTLLVSLLSLVRQRNQILFFIFHFPRMVGVNILSYLDGVLVKEPGIWDVEYGGKGEFLGKIMRKAYEAFEKRDRAKRVGLTFVSSQNFEGMLHNPLPSFWSDELSRAWAGVTLFDVQPTLGFEPTGLKCEDGSPVTPDMLKRKMLVDEIPSAQHRWLVFFDPVTGKRWLEVR